jgi:hypothetical protein
MLREESRERDNYTLAEMRQIGDRLIRVEQYLSTQNELLSPEPEAAQPEADHNNNQSRTPPGSYGIVTRPSRCHYNKSAIRIFLEKRGQSTHTWRHIGFELIIGCSIVIGFETALHTSDLSCPWISFNIRMRNVIPTSSEIVRACKEGNVGVVRKLLYRGEARPNDMTEEQHPLIFVRASDYKVGSSGQADKCSTVCDSERLNRRCQMFAT